MVEPIYRGKEQTQKKANFKEPIKVPIFLEIAVQQTILLYQMQKTTPHDHWIEEVWQIYVCWEKSISYLPNIT